MYDCISPTWGLLKANQLKPLLALFVMLSTLQNSTAIGQGDFVRRMPEYRTFPWESKVIHNIMLSAAMLHVKVCCCPIDPFVLQ
jgi:hypothetical protein